MDDIKISYTNLGTYWSKKTGKIEARKPNTNDPLQVVDLKTVWLSQVTLDPNAMKGASGEIYPFAFNKFYDIEYIKKEKLCSNGVVFVDIDCGEEMVDKVYQSIPQCNDIMGMPIIAAAPTKKGLHILMASLPLLVDEYRVKSFIYLTGFARAVNKITGIDLRNISGALDACTFSMKQRLYLRYCKDVYWNDLAAPVSYPKDMIDILKKDYPVWAKKAYKNNSKQLKGVAISCTSKVLEVFDVPMHPYIPHKGWDSRWMLFDSLCCCYADNEAELWRQWDRCAELIYPENHGPQHFKDEPRDNEWLKKWLESDRRLCNDKLLLEFGYKTKPVDVYYKPIPMPDSIDDLL